MKKAMLLYTSAQDPPKPRNGRSHNRRNLALNQVAGGGKIKRKHRAIHDE